MPDVTVLENPLKPEQLLYDPKIRDYHSLGNAIQVLRKQKNNLKVGFTNGKFRSLHVGHSVYLSIAKTQCDILVVAINSDLSLRLLKQPSKMSTKERAFCISSLSVVDYVTVFDEENPYLCISSVNPDVIFKGPDYKDKEVVSGNRNVVIIDHPFDIHVSDLESKDSIKTKYFDV